MIEWNAQLMKYRQNSYIILIAAKNLVKYNCWSISVIYTCICIDRDIAFNTT